MNIDKPPANRTRQPDESLPNRYEDEPDPLRLSVPEIYQALEKTKRGGADWFLGFAGHAIGRNVPHSKSVEYERAKGIIEDFLKQFPNADAFDARFGEQEILELDSVIANEPLEWRKEALGTQRTLVRQRLKENYAEWKKILYGASQTPHAEQTTKHTGRYLEALAYQDAPLSKEELERMREYTATSESASRYAIALESLEQALGGKEQVEKLANSIHGEMMENARRLNLPVSPYGISKTWAVWDLGKQHYFYTHPSEADTRYKITPAQSPEKMQEIADRHLGWEAYMTYRGNPTWRKQIDGDSRYAKAQEYFSRSPKENGTLSSLELAELGKILREV